MNRNNVNMLSGSITKGLLSLTIPIIIMNVMQSLFNIIDMTTLKIFSNGSAVGAVGVCGTLITLCTSLLIGVSAGANVVIAKRLGSGNRERADKAVMTSLLLSIIGGLILMVIGLIFAEKFLIMVNCADSLLPQATLYFRLYFLCIPASMFYNFCASILRATGDAKRPMYILILGGIIKVLFTLFFIGVFNMGVAGVAIATIISTFTTCVFALYILIKRQDIVSVNFKKLKFNWSELKEVLYIGLPTGVQSALYSLANVVISAAVNRFGAAATTGISIANQFDGILYVICQAPSLAVIPYISQNAGAGNIKRIKQTFLRAVLITIAFGASFGSLSAIFSRQLSSIMSSDAAAIAYSQQKMIIISSTYFICGINEVVGGVLRGIRKPIVPTVATLIFMCLLRFVWVYLIFPLYPNLTFLYTVWPVGWILSIIFLMFFYVPAISALSKKLASSQD